MKDIVLIFTRIMCYFVIVMISRTIDIMVMLSIIQQSSYNSAYTLIVITIICICGYIIDCTYRWEYEN